MRRNNTIDVYHWHHWRLWSMPSHERKLYHLDESDEEPRRDMNPEWSSGRHNGFRMSLGVEIRRNRRPIPRSGGNTSMESQNSGPEEKWSIECSFSLFLLFSSLLHTSLLHWISDWYKWRRHGFYHLWVPIHRRQSFPARRIRLRATLSGIDQLWDIWFDSSTYGAALFNTFFPLICGFLLYSLCSPGGLHLKRGIM